MWDRPLPSLKSHPEHHCPVKGGILVSNPLPPPRRQCLTPPPRPRPPLSEARRPPSCVEAHRVNPAGVRGLLACRRCLHLNLDTQEIRLRKHGQKQREKQREPRNIIGAGGKRSVPGPRAWSGNVKQQKDIGEGCTAVADLLNAKHGSIDHRMAAGRDRSKGEPNRARQITRPSRSYQGKYGLCLGEYCSTAWFRR